MSVRYNNSAACARGRTIAAHAHLLGFAVSSPAVTLAHSTSRDATNHIHAQTQPGQPARRSDHKVQTVVAMAMIQPHTRLWFSERRVEVSARLLVNLWSERGSASGQSKLVAASSLFLSFFF